MPVKHGVSSDVRSAQTWQNGVLMRFLEAEHMVEAETPRLVDHAMVPKQSTGDVANDDIGPFAGAATVRGIENVMVAPIQ